MSYKIEGRDLVWGGFEDGIADDPYTGINDIVGMNVISIPGEASVSFSPAVSTSVLTGTITSVDTGTEIITANITTGAVQNYTAVTFTNSGGALPAPLVAGTVYWVNYQSSNTFKIYSDCYLNTVVNLTTSGSGTNTFASVDIGEVKYFDKVLGYCIDANSRVWSPVVDNGIIRYTFMNNTLTNGNGNGIVMWRGTYSASATKYLFYFTNNKIYYTSCADTLGIFTGNGTYESGITPSWTEWKTLITSSSQNYPHEAVVDGSNKVFFIDGGYVGSWRELPLQTFDPTNSATYEFVDTTSSAFALPANEIAQSIESLSDTLLIGGISNYVYTWDRKSTGGNWFQIAEKGIFKMITVSTNVFIFAGKRGRIYKSNGSQAQLFKKIPDHLLGIDPVFTWKNVAFNKNQLYFGFTVTDNAGSSSTVYSGLWAIDVETEALRRPVLCSTTTADTMAIFALPSSSVGYSFLVAWKSGSNYGIDYTLSTPYTTYVPYVVTDMTPVGLYLNKRTFENIEFKLSAPLASSEGVYIYYRSNLTDAFTAVGEYTTAGDLSGIIPINFENVQWIQLKAFTKSKASSPSYTRLRELRIR